MSSEQTSTSCTSRHRRKPRNYTSNTIEITLIKASHTFLNSIQQCNGGERRHNCYQLPESVDQLMTLAMCMCSEGIDNIRSSQRLTEVTNGQQKLSLKVNKAPENNYRQLSRALKSPAGASRRRNGSGAATFTNAPS